MLRHALLAAPLLLALAAPSPAAPETTSFVADVTFEIQRAAATEDPAGATEQAVVEAAKKTLGADFPGELEVKVDKAGPPDRPGSVELKLRSPTDLRPVIERMVVAVKALKTDRPVAMVRQAVRGQTWRGSEDEGEQRVDRTNWKRTWRQSMGDVEGRLRQRAERRVVEADEDGASDEGDEAAPAGGERRRIEIRKRVERQAPAGEQAPRGVLKLLVDEGKGRIQRLVASEVPLGAVLARLAGVLPVTYVLAESGLARYEVSLALSDVTPEQVLLALARASECTIATEGGVPTFTRKR